MRGEIWLKRIALAVVAVAVLYLAWALWDYQAVMGWMERARPLPFFVATALLPAIGAPLTPFFLLAGATFGVQTALVGSLIALAANMTLCYWIGRSGLRPRLVSILQRFDYSLPDFEPDTGKSAARSARFTAMIKAAPGVPGFIKNYGLGAARVPFWIFLAVGIVFSGVYAAALIVLGDSIFDHNLSNGALAIIVLAAAGLGVWLWMRKRGAREQLPHAI
jgi:uncharacterized membrane protein YdjX (TVP38/TMEM64 family)